MVPGQNCVRAHPHQSPLAFSLPGVGTRCECVCVYACVCVLRSAAIMCGACAVGGDHRAVMLDKSRPQAGCRKLVLAAL
jgi:hypothetical protein